MEMNRADALAVLEPPDDLLDRRDGEGPDDRPRQALDPADDEHRDEEERDMEVEIVRRKASDPVAIEGAADTNHERADRERDQSLTGDPDAGSSRRHRILARGTKPQTDAAVLEQPRRRDRDRAPSEGRSRGGCEGHTDERRSSAGDALPFAEHDVRDHQQGKRRYR